MIVSSVLDSDARDVGEESEDRVVTSFGLVIGLVIRVDEGVSDESVPLPETGLLVLNVEESEEDSVGFESEPEAVVGAEVVDVDWFDASVFGSVCVVVEFDD